MEVHSPDKPGAARPIICYTDFSAQRQHWRELLTHILDVQPSAESWCNTGNMLVNVNLKFSQATKDVTNATPSQVKLQCVCYFALLITRTFQTFSSGVGFLNRSQDLTAHHCQRFPRRCDSRTHVNAAAFLCGGLQVLLIPSLQEKICCNPWTERVAERRVGVQRRIAQHDWST